MTVDQHPGLRERIALTYRHLGLGTVLWRVVTFPLRFTPLRYPLGFARGVDRERYEARRWQRRYAPPVTIIGPGEQLAAPPGHDLAVLGAGLRPGRHWTAVLQQAAHSDDRPAVVSGKVVGAGGRIVAAGLARDHRCPERLVGRFSGRPIGYGPADVATDILAASASCALIRGDALGRLGTDGGVEALSLRAWAAAGA